MIQFDYIIFFKWVETTNQMKYTTPGRIDGEAIATPNVLAYHGPPPYFIYGTFWEWRSGELRHLSIYGVNVGWFHQTSLFLGGGFQVVVFEEEGTYIFFMEQKQEETPPSFWRRSCVPPLSSGAGVACAPKNVVSLVHLKSAMF